MKFKLFENPWLPSIISSVIIVSILCLVIFILYLKIRKLKPTDSNKGILLVVELIVDSINKFAKSYFGKYWKYYAPYILTLGLFLFFSNTSGIWGIRPPTVSLNVTLTLGLITFLMIHVTGIVNRGFFKWLKGFAEPLPFMLPLNIIGELAFPISLSLRLFGNIFSGLIIMTLIYGGFEGLAGVLGGLNVSFLVTPVFHAIFDIFFGIIQVLVFVLLTTIFVSGQIGDLEQQ